MNGITMHDDTPIDELGLSTRSANALRRERITTIGELTGRNGWDLLDIHNFGVGCYREVVSALARHGLKLADAPESWGTLPAVDIAA